MVGVGGGTVYHPLYYQYIHSISRKTVLGMFRAISEKLRICELWDQKNRIDSISKSRMRKKRAKKRAENHGCTQYPCNSQLEYISLKRRAADSQRANARPRTHTQTLAFKHRVNKSFFGLSCQAWKRLYGENAKKKWILFFFGKNRLSNFWKRVDLWSIYVRSEQFHIHPFGLNSIPRITFKMFHHFQFHFRITT